MNRKHTGGPAFPQDYEHTKVLVQMHEDGDISIEQLQKLTKQLAGMTLRQYAAIKLKVPNSGDAWLDDMIRESLQNDFAAKAMQGMLAYPGCESRGSHHNNNTPDGVAEMAYGYADAMLKAREQ